MPVARPRRELIAVGCHVFAGGFTLGVRQAGFRVPCHLEDGRFGAETVRLNMPDVVLHQDPASWPLEELYRPDLVFCNPPCSPWSTAGIVRGQTTEQQTDWRSHPACRYSATAFSLLSDLRPTVWCTESVRQVYSKGGEMLDDMARTAADLGYDVHDLFVEARHHGVPQHRKRYFMVCSRVRIDWRMPVQAEEPTVYAALEDLDGEDDEVGSIPRSVLAVCGLMSQGENARMAWDREVRAGRDPGCPRPAFIYDRMAGDRPSYTLLGSCNKVHPDLDRMLSVNESKALCGFPREYKIVGKTADRYAQVGKGVCPPVARWLASEVRRALESAVPVRSPSRKTTEVVSVKPNQE